MSSVENYKTIFLSRLEKLTNSQASIQSLSLWCIYHYKLGEMLVNTWKEYMFKAGSSRFVVLIYLANDVLQNSKRKTNSYIELFSGVLPDVISKIMSSSSLDEKNKSRVTRVLDLWVERDVFSKEFVEELKSVSLRRRSPVKSPRSPVSPPPQQQVIPPPPMTKNPIVQALIDLEEIENEGLEGKIGLSDCEFQINRLTPILSSDLIDISQMDLGEMKELHQEYTKHGSDIEILKKQYRKEALSIKNLSDLLSTELSKQQKKLESKYRPSSKFFTDGKKKIKEFIDRLEVSMNSKQIDDQNDFSYVENESFLSSTLQNRKRKINNISGGEGNNNTISKKRKLDNNNTSNNNNSKDDDDDDDKSSDEMVELPKDLLEHNEVDVNLDGLMKGLYEK